jgi:MFS family permease
LAGYSARFLFLNVGHAYAHLFMLLYPTVVLALEIELGRDYGELLLPSTAGFAAFGAGALPAGWLGDRWSREKMIALMFFGLGAGAMVTGLSDSAWGLAAGLGLIGLAASIYHPVGIAMVVETRAPLGRALGINGVFGNMGVAAGPLVAGALSAGLGWRAAFLLPGAIAVATGLAYLLVVRRPAPAAAGQPAAETRAAESGGRIRVLVFLVVSGLFGGLAFHATTISLPKLLDEAVGAALAGPMGAGGLAAAIFAGAAFAQIAVGRMIDRHAIRSVALVILCLQVPLLYAVGQMHGWAAVAVGFAMMLFVFGEIPVTDALLARHSSTAWRARLYALKYLLSLGVSAAAVPAVALLHRPETGFARLYLVLAVLIALVAAAATALPAERRRAAACRPVVPEERAGG